ncbi:nitrogen regulatory protein P-II homolog isoform X4 [Apium graveolens]|uniref:nitrogen regulatory protein P-II homolog isoform X4 n=1 Tax=Apium graveolens TaxID=4045 RepID=UPI003D7A21BC
MMMMIIAVFPKFIPDGDIPSDGYSSPPSCGDDPQDILLKMNWLRMEVNLPPLNSWGNRFWIKKGKYVSLENHWPASSIGQALLRMGILSVTVSDVKCFGDQGPNMLVSKIKMETVVSKNQVEEVILNFIVQARVCGDGGTSGAGYRQQEGAGYRQGAGYNLCLPYFIPCFRMQVHVFNVFKRKFMCLMKVHVEAVHVFDGSSM